jgi:hypothetical protein
MTRSAFPDHSRGKKILELCRMTSLDAFNQAPTIEQDGLRAISVEDYSTFERCVCLMSQINFCIDASSS